MSATYSNWDKGRIGVNVTYKEPTVEGIEVTKSLVLPNRVSVRTQFNYKPLHGLNEWNQGIIEQAPEFTFTIGLPSVSASTRLLRALHVSGIPFAMLLQDATNSGEFQLIAEKLVECRITARELNVVVEDVPLTVFSGMALRYTYSDINGVVDQEFGDGKPVEEDLFSEWEGS